METGKTYTIKLNSGEELIAKVTEIHLGQGYVVVTNPVSIAPTQQGGMQMIPSMFTADIDQEIRINTNSISLYAYTEQSVADKYLEATTGIKMPEKKIILG
jgi:hypothetical protein